MAFEGWRGDFIGFFRGLQLDNSKRYFEANRKLFETEVRRPMEELVAELEPILGPGKIFRINRDIRFSADKSPYKTNIAAHVGHAYIHLDARQMYLATGAWQPDSAWLNRYREAINGPAGAEFEELVGALRAAGCSVGGDPLKTAPRGYAADHPRIEFLRWRHVTTSKGFEIGPWIASAEAKDRLLETWVVMRPFNEWMRVKVPS